MYERTIRTYGLLAVAALAQSGCLDRDSSGRSGAHDPTPTLDVGEPYQGPDSSTPGTIIEIQTQDLQAGCFQIEVEYPAEWDCTPAQVEEAEASGYGTYDPYGYYDYGAPMPGPASSMVYYDEPPPPVDLDANVALLAKTCEQLAQLRRPAVAETYKQTLDVDRLTKLATKCLTRTVYYWVNERGEEDPDCDSRAMWDYGAVGTGGTSAMPGAVPAPNEGGASEYSTTNNQVAGVDEADLVKNDASTIYVATPDGVRVIDAWPAADTHEAAFIQVPGEPRRLFLYDDKLVIYSRQLDFAPHPDGYTYNAYDGTECTYGYGCRFSADGGRTLILVYDVAIPAAPEELARFELSGSYAAARRVGPYVYTVVHDGGLQGIPGVDVTLDATGPADLEAQYAEREVQVDQAVEQAPTAAFLPWASKMLQGGVGEPELSPCQNALAGPAAAGATFVSVVALDLDTLAPPTRSVVGTKPGFVYASADALYMTVDGVEGGDMWYSHADPGTDASVVHKFALNGASTDYVGSRAIRGHVLNQFAMDEHLGVLRVATSSGWVPDPEVSSNVTTLTEVGGDLVRVGELTGLAPREDIRSVRFNGDTGFIVTFVKTDPLFVIDLRDPAAPSVLGELHIPGFSTYMHLLDETHLLAVGFDADEHDDFAYFDGILIQILDVTDLTNPQLLHRYVVGTRGSGSEALMNHLAFNYFAPAGLLALPLTVCEGGNDGVYGDTLTFSGLMTFNIDLVAGITEHGRMPFIDPTTADSSSSPDGCGQWWTDSTSLVKRSIFMDEFLYGLSDDVLNVAALADLQTVLQSVPLVEVTAP